MSTVPAKATLRAEAQRARILDAARRCFSERGFQGASIAAIAEAAGMSQGLIYRYFTNKAAIIRAITDQHSEGRRNALDDLGSVGQLVDRLIELIDDWRAGSTCDQDIFDPALFLEVTAEATRDSDIASVVAAQEKLVWADFEDFLRRSARSAGQAVDENSIRERTIVLRCLLDGLILCYVRDPVMDRELLRRSLQDAVTTLSL